MRIALAQINPTVGDLAGNVDRMSRAARDAAARGAEVVVFPELSITGYPPRDLVEKPSFIDRSEARAGTAGARNRRSRSERRLRIRGAIAGGDRQARAEQRGGHRARASRVPAEQDAAADLRRLRRGALFPAGGTRVSVHAARQAHRADHLRGRLERPAVLEAAALSARSGGGTVRGRRRNADLHQRVSL